MYTLRLRNVAGYAIVPVLQGGNVDLCTYTPKPAPSIFTAAAVGTGDSAEIRSKFDMIMGAANLVHAPPPVLAALQQVGEQWASAIGAQTEVPSKAPQQGPDLMPTGAAGEQPALRELDEHEAEAEPAIAIPPAVAATASVQQPAAVAMQPAVAAQTPQPQQPPQHPQLLTALLPQPPAQLHMPAGVWQQLAQPAAVRQLAYAAAEPIRAAPAPALPHLMQLPQRIRLGGGSLATQVNRLPPLEATNGTGTRAQTQRKKVPTSTKHTTIPKVCKCFYRALMLLATQPVIWRLKVCPCACTITQYTNIGTPKAWAK